MIYTLEESHNLAIELITITTLSIIVLLFTVYCYFKFEQLQHCQFKLVIRILISDLLYTSIILCVSIAYLCTNTDQQSLAFRFPSICQLQAFLSNFSILSSCAWTSVICHKLYQQVFISDNNLYNCYQLTLGYGIPCILSGIPLLIPNAYGEANPMPQTNCFYNSLLPNSLYYAYILPCYYIPILTAFTYNTIIMSLVVYKITSIQIDITTPFYGLFIYPTILAICWVIPGIIAQINVDEMILAYIGQFLCNSIGLFDGLCYCFTEVFSRIYFDGCSLHLKEQSQRTISCDLSVQTASPINPSMEPQL